MKLAELTTAQTEEITDALDLAVEELLVNHPEAISAYRDAVVGVPLARELKIFTETVDLDGDLYDLPDGKDFAENVHDYLKLNSVRFEDNDRAQDLLSDAQRYNALFV